MKTNTEHWKVALSDLCYDESERRAVEEVLASKWLTMGPRVEAFEQALSRRLGGARVILTSSCTAALHLALMASDIGPNDEVIVPSLTFAATANVVRAVGARPVFADIVSPEEPTLDPARVAELITERTKAVVPMHYAGYSCRMFEMFQIAVCGDRRIAILEDAAHAFGATGGTDRPLGAMGDAGALSFFSNKNLATGEGGAAVSNDPQLADRMRRLRSHGLSAGTWERHKGGGAQYDVVEPGLNYRPSEITAALGLAQLEKFDAMQARREAVHHRYVERLRDVSEATIPFVGRDIEGRPAWHIFPVLLPDSDTRDRVAEALRERGIQTSHHYRPLHTMAAYRPAAGEGAAPLPHTESFAARELTLPLHANMSVGDADLVADAFKNALTS